MGQRIVKCMLFVSIFFTFLSTLDMHCRMLLFICLFIKTYDKPEYALPCECDH